MRLVNESARIGPRTVDGKINFCRPDGGRSKVFAGEYARNTSKHEPHLVTIVDGSVPPADTELDREGFRLVRHQSAVTDFDDAEQYENIYKPEIARLMLELTGGDHVELLGTCVVRRSPGITGIDRDDTTRPVHFPHIDASDTGIYGLLDFNMPERPRKVKRWAFYNTWRQLAVAPVDEPLAVCDARSIRREDLRPYDSYFPNGMAFESLMLCHNEEQRWTFFSKMSRDDLLIFKTNDSDPDKAHFVPHTAFADTTNQNPSPRISTELRAYVCWF